VALVILISGAPGSGKGTQASLLSAHFGIPAISTGELLRAEVRAVTQLGRQLGSLLKRGEYASDDLVNRIIAAHIESPESAGGVILDGYPRTRAQSLFLAALLTRLSWPDPWLIHLDVPTASIVARLQSRRQCVACGLSYNLLTRPPNQPGICDHCQTPLTPRPDDAPEVVTERIKTYTAIDPEELNCWAPSRRLVLNGTQPPADILDSIVSALSEAT
jgi:adenylate kinase